MTRDDAISHIRGWDATRHHKSLLPVRLTAESTRREYGYVGWSVQNILAILDILDVLAVPDGRVRNAEGAAIATLTLVCDGVRLATRAEVLSWVAAAVQKHLLCIRKGGDAVVPDITSHDALEACLRAAPAGARLICRLVGCKKVYGCNPYLCVPLGDAHPYSLTLLYTLSEEVLDRAERAMMGRGYELPGWRSSEARQIDVPLHAFIRQPFFASLRRLIASLRLLCGPHSRTATATCLTTHYATACAPTWAWC